MKEKTKEKLEKIQNEIIEQEKEEMCPEIVTKNKGEYENFDDTLKKGWSFEKEGKEYFEYMINDEVVFVAQDKEKIVGYLAGSNSSYISGIYIDARNSDQ